MKKNKFFIKNTKHFINRKSIFNFLIVNLILLIIAIGDVFFFIPSKITSGGLFGVAIIFFHLLGIKTSAATYVGTLVFILNIPLLCYSYFYFEKSYFTRSFYCTLALPLMEAIIDKIIQFFDYRIVEPNLYISLIIGTLIQGFFTTLIMYLGSSTGGLDIAARMINRYFRRISIGTAYTIFSLIIIGLSFITFDSERVIVSILSIFGTGYLIDFSLKRIFKIEDLNQDYRGEENV